MTETLRPGDEEYEVAIQHVGVARNVGNRNDLRGPGRGPVASPKVRRRPILSEEEDGVVQRGGRPTNKQAAAEKQSAVGRPVGPPEARAGPIVGGEEEQAVPAADGLGRR